MNSLRSESMDRLFGAILQLRDLDECYRFFEDICTVKEQLDLAQRLDVAVLLDQGESYQAISEKVNVSTATISRVSKCLNYGAGGYRTDLSRMKQEDEK